MFSSFHFYFLDVIYWEKQTQPTKGSCWLLLTKKIKQIAPNMFSCYFCGWMWGWDLFPARWTKGNLVIEITKECKWNLTLGSNWKSYLARWSSKKTSSYSPSGAFFWTGTRSFYTPSSFFCFCLDLYDQFSFNMLVIFTPTPYLPLPFWCVFV